MTEVREAVPRVWVEFADPENAVVVYRCDLTWLTSRWGCIFGVGCPGIVASSPTAGCCSLGAHVCSEEDLERVTAAVDRLDSSLWQQHRFGMRDGWTELDSDDKTSVKTRVLDGACIFHNSPAFAAGSGCALHLLARRDGLRLAEVKPDVCWQVPLRRTYRTYERPDGASVLEVSIGEYDRDGWGPGGADLDWYCSSHPRAHRSLEPVWVSCRDELVELMSEASYAVLTRMCEDFDAANFCRHPADPHV